MHTYLQRLLLALRILAPGEPWSALASLVRRLTPPPPDPTRRLEDVRHPAELLALAEYLMTDVQQTVAAEGRRHHAAILYRDGLILAILALSALRRRSLLHLALGTTLLSTDDSYTIVLAPEHTKARRSETIPLHPTLTEWIDRYLTRYRPVLLHDRDTPALWIAHDGQPLDENGVWHAVRRHTVKYLGVPINPHFIRHCIGTTAAVEDPDRIGDLPAILQHRGFRVSERHYILAEQLAGRSKYQSAITAERCDLQCLPA